MRKNEMGEIGRTDRSRYHKIRRVLADEYVSDDRFDLSGLLSNPSVDRTPEDSFDHGVLKRYIREMIDSLDQYDDRLPFVFEAYHIGGHTLEEIGGALSLTRSRIRQLLRKSEVLICRRGNLEKLFYGFEI
tara:strand:+ start:100 stop:492 length:393 start_codon:yes stop_codon:yes gene_type:complete